jgi:hypothetical protein
MLKKIFFLLVLFVAVFCSSAFAQQKAVISDAKAKVMLLGRHRLSLQWISWDYFGSATVTEKNGKILLTGRQNGRGASSKDYLIVDGIVTSISAKEFTFNGKITTRVSHINSGEPCVREGKMTFKITGKRRYWRLQEMDNPCEGVTDYVDIYFR